MSLPSCRIGLPDMPWTMPPVTGKKALVGDGEKEVPPVFRLRIKLIDAHTIFPGFFAVDVCENDRRARMDLRCVRNRNTLALRQSGEFAENAVRLVLRDGAKRVCNVKAPMELARRAAHALFHVCDARRDKHAAGDGKRLRGGKSRDAVSQRAIHAGLRVKECDRSDAGNVVTDGNAEAVAGFRFLGGQIKFRLLFAPADAEADAFAAR